jgi:hypothetical protein
MKSYFPNVLEILLDSNNQDDISSYVYASVLGLKKRNFPMKLRQEIEEALIEGSNGRFLWVDLILYYLKTALKLSPSVIQQKLTTLSKCLPDLSRKILLVVTLEDLEAANNILRWVVWAERPLTLQELAIASAIQTEHRSMSALPETMELDLENVLISMLGPLIVVHDGTVYLVHQSLKGFLKESNSIPSEQFSLQPNDSYLHITISCLTYLSFDEFETGNEEYNGKIRITDRFEQYKFLQYCSKHWPDHIRQLDEESQWSPALKKAFLHLAQAGNKFELS